MYSKNMCKWSISTIYWEKIQIWHQISFILLEFGHEVGVCLLGLANQGVFTPTGGFY